MQDDDHSCCSPSERRAVDEADHAGFDADPERRAATEGMIALPGGRFLMGTDFAQRILADGEGPVRPVVVSPFSMDVVPVTNMHFAEFIAATGYRTEAERFGWSFVFWSHIDAGRFSSLVDDTVAQAPWWCKVSGASWKAPEGPGSMIDERQDHPVVHVSYHDASAYAAWAGKQLPTEAEWEYAARGGLEQKIFPWGDELEPGGRHMCNVWQGEFPRNDTAEDGYAGSCPVRAFPANGYGMYSMIGNVWEWTADWFGTQHARGETTDPRGPANGTNKVMKGGSFLCHASYCNRYRIGARSKNTPDSSASNIGFRCVRRG
jgi:sulfatase modifying factor 1